MSILQYRTNTQCPSASDLATGECVIRRAGATDGADEWWMLWFCFVRTDNQQREIAAVPIAPNGVASENGPGGRTWGFTKTSGLVWRVSPSINVLDHPTAGISTHAGEHPDPTLLSVWHETPDIVDVRDGEAWQSA